MFAAGSIPSLPSQQCNSCSEVHVASMLHLSLKC
uniref:Uncharacterized protein n=1 Tax=Arundo donax TaxID=35708 RepID=A0A0A9ERV0_ARUDO